MDRRSFLAGLGTAGVLASMTFPGVQRRVSIADQDSVPDEYEVSIEVELLQPVVTDSHPAQLEITTTNEGPERALSVGPRWCGLFSRGRGTVEPEGLRLRVPGRFFEGMRRDGNRWQRDPSSPSGFTPAHGCVPTLYEPGESVTNEYELWDDHTVEGYLEPGTYRFETELGVRDGPYADETHDSFTWGFSLTIENPG